MLADAGSLLTHRGLDKSDGSKTITTPPARALAFVDVAGELFVIGSQLYKKHRGQLGQIQRDLPPTQPKNCTKRARALAPARLAPAMTTVSVLNGALLPPLGTPEEGARTPGWRGLATVLAPGQISLHCG